MITKQCLIAPLAALGFTFSSEIAFAAKNNDAGFLVTAWPLIVLSIVLIVFRKQLIIQATPEQADADHHETPVKKTRTAAPATKKPAAISNANIDLKDGGTQCQAATSKGTRCKRKSNLEDASVSVNRKTYDLTVCKQHNNDALQIFSGLIK
ncbi:MAG: hypothetical protein HFP78_01735 [Methylococcales symbiont of Hymedesmia sp. n. MRB-2018]|nr:MAG: hypothetical protein HFP78_01735 [Methylococcales symbiont of Hymedesmia sp. n. MRB-2018]